MYKVFDSETENHEYRRRFASPFYDKNWVVMRGWKRQDDTRAYHSYHPENVRTYLEIEDDVTILVGHNIKFDLLYEWDNPKLQDFFRRGGRVWCTMYAEYLLGSMEQKFHMIAMDDIAEKYGGRVKLDAVKELWEAGYLTSEIDPDLLKDYLIGTKEEGYDSGDIGNTEKIFLGQLERARKNGMLPMILARMDGLCATTEMEFNGIKIDIKEAKRRMKELEDRLDIVEEELEGMLPELPDGLTFKWTSKNHISALIFGGAVKYRMRVHQRDDDGKLMYKKAKADWPLFDGAPVDPAKCKQRGDEVYVYKGKKQDLFLSGKKKGSPKFKKVDVRGEAKMRFEDFIHDFPGYAVPKPAWEMKLTDARDAPLYGTGEEIIEEVALTNKKIPFLKLFLERQNLIKDLSTYYLRHDPKKDKYNGMLTCVMPNDHIIHHNLNHVATVTGRLSSNKPNLQNIPRKGTSQVKKMFISRYKNGVMIEIDYSQLEVVVQGLLSGDKALIKDLINKIDFHCKRVSAKFGITYEEAVYLCKDENAPDHTTWKGRRTGCKEFSFQRAYGAGAAAIAATTGMDIEDIKLMIEAEELLYPGIPKYNAAVESEVKRTSKPFRDFTRGGKVYRKGWYTAPTGTRYCFRTYDAPEWLQRKGIEDSFMPTEMKNYPVQGTGGEIVQIVLGRLWRHFNKKKNYNGQAVLCNTVHDCVWADTTEDVKVEVATDMKRIMESVPQLLKKLYNMDCPVPFPVEVEAGKNMYDLHVLHIKEENNV